MITTPRLNSSNVLLRMFRKVNDRFSSYLKRRLNLNALYSYSNFSIFLPANHMRPIYQEHHRKYDRFLPHLVKYIGDGESIIDVGANVGDTLAGMVEANQSSKYICIEPDDIFSLLGRKYKAY